MMMVMLMIVATVAVLMMMVVLMLQSFQGLLHRGSTFHRLQQLFAGQLTPGGGDQGSSLVVLTQQLHRRVQFCLRNGIGPGQNNGGGRFDLIVIEFTEVLHIDLDLAGIGNGYPIPQAYLFAGDLFHRCHHIGQLAHTGGFDDDPVRVVFGDHFIQSLSKIAHQGAANAAGIHLRDVDPGFLQETAVNADLTEFVFDEHQLLAAIGFLDHLFDEGGLTCTQETGINVNDCHYFSPSV